MIKIGDLVAVESQFGYFLGIVINEMEGGVWRWRRAPRGSGVYSTYRGLGVLGCMWLERPTWWCLATRWSRFVTNAFPRARGCLSDRPARNS